MSSSSVHELLALLDAALPRVDASVVSAVRGVAFWTAIALPFLYVPLLVSGLNTGSTRAAFVALVACNAVALYVGHTYRGE